MRDDPLNRLSAKRGSDLPQSKLDEKEVIKIRRQYAKAQLAIARIQSRWTAKGIARTYGLHHRTIEKILSGATWTHVG
jgi:glutamate 5-kinase